MAVHCLYGVDKNPLAVELAKLSLWLISDDSAYVSGADHLIDGGMRA